jgi:hypothetical protein
VWSTDFSNRQARKILNRRSLLLVGGQGFEPCHPRSSTRSQRCINPLCTPVLPPIREKGSTTYELVEPWRKHLTFTPQAHIQSKCSLRARTEEGPNCTALPWWRRTREHDEPLGRQTMIAIGLGLYGDRWVPKMASALAAFHPRQRAESRATSAIPPTAGNGAPRGFGILCRSRAGMRFRVRQAFQRQLAERRL